MGFDNFVTKFTNTAGRPNQYIRGSKIPFYLQLWRDLINSGVLSFEALKDYYRCRILMSTDEVKARSEAPQILGLPVTRPSVTEIKAAANLMARSSDGVHRTPRAVRFTPHTDDG